MSFNNTIGDKVSFDQNGVFLTAFDVINWVLFPNKSFFGIKVGMINSQEPRDPKLTMNKNLIVWNSWFNQVRYNLHSLGTCLIINKDVIIVLKCIIAQNVSAKHNESTKYFPFFLISSNHTFWTWYTHKNIFSPGLL